MEQKNDDEFAAFMAGLGLAALDEETYSAAWAAWRHQRRKIDALKDMLDDLRAAAQLLSDASWRSIDEA